MNTPAQQSLPTHPLSRISAFITIYIRENAIQTHACLSCSSKKCPPPPPPPKERNHPHIYTHETLNVQVITRLHINTASRHLPSHSVTLKKQITQHERTVLHDMCHRSAVSSSTLKPRSKAEHNLTVRIWLTKEPKRGSIGTHISSNLLEECRRIHGRESVRRRHPVLPTPL